MSWSCCVSQRRCFRGTVPLRVLEKVGVQEEGQRREHREKEDAYVDVMYSGLLQTDGVATEKSSE